MNNENKPENPEEPEQIIDEIDERLDALHNSFVDVSTHVGYARDVFRAVRPLWQNLGDASTNDPDAASLYSSGVDFLKAYRDELRSLEGLTSQLSSRFQNMSGSATYFITATETSATYFPDAVTFRPQDYPAFPFPDQHKSYTERFSQFDPALGKTYQGILEVLYATRADPERAALYLIRQAFDHLFAKLAPDDEVRKSPYWIKKAEKGREDQIWREERIQFAAYAHIQDKARANTLLAAAKQMLDAYQALNRAHTRGELDQSKARLSLAQMREFLEDWADATGI